MRSSGDAGEGWRSASSATPWSLWPPARRVLLGLAGFLVSYAPSGFNPGGYITGSDSQLGEAVLESHFGAAVLGSTDVVFRIPTPAWDDPSVIAQGEDGLDSTGLFTSLSDAFTAGGLRIRPDGLGYAYRHLGPPGDLPPLPPPGSEVPTAFYNAYRATAQFITPDGHSILYRVSLRAGSPGSTAALQAIPAIRGAVATVATEIGATANGVAGQAPGAADVSTISGSDIVRIVPVVLVVLTLLLALVLRSLIAPLYLVASVVLSYLASLGFAVLVFVVAGHGLGINFTLPFFMFVFIMALGEDYNILVMTRIREEAGRAPSAGRRGHRGGQHRNHRDVSRTRLGRDVRCPRHHHVGPDPSDRDRSGLRDPPRHLCGANALGPVGRRLGGTLELVAIASIP